MNSVNLIGNLVADVDMRYTATGKAVASFKIAVTEKQGEKETTAFIPVVAWQKNAEHVGNNLSKGNKVFVSGRLSTRSYEAQDGSKRYVTEVIANFVSGSITNDGNRQSGTLGDFGVFGNDVNDPPY